MYYTTTNNNPSAWICNPSDKGRKKIYLNSKVYLDNGSEFQIELFNPLNEAVLAELKINGKLASSTGIVLRPGERFYLDCFIDDKKKFIFKTYLSDGSSQGQAAVANNGFIEISFFKEKTKYQTYGTIDYTSYISDNMSKSIAYCDYLAENLDKSIVYSEYICENKDKTINYSNYLSNTINSCGNVTNSVNLNNMVSSNTSSIDLNNTNFYKQTLNQPLFKNTINSSANTIGKYPTGAKLPEAQVETGRIEKGNTSAQKFESVNMEFNTYCINKISYQLLPESKKPIETSEIKSNNNFCCNCGYKLKGGEKFCPSCGTKI